MQRLGIGLGPCVRVGNRARSLCEGSGPCVKVWEWDEVAIVYFKPNFQTSAKLLPLAVQKSGCPMQATGS